MSTDPGGLVEPTYPCRVMPTRRCPPAYEGVCGEDRPCARFESEDETPWLERGYD